MGIIDKIVWIQQYFYFYQQNWIWVVLFVDIVFSFMFLGNLFQFEFFSLLLFISNIVFYNKINNVQNGYLLEDDYYSFYGLLVNGFCGDFLE